MGAFCLTCYANCLAPRLGNELPNIVCFAGPAKGRSAKAVATESEAAGQALEEGSDK